MEPDSSPSTHASPSPSRRATSFRRPQRIPTGTPRSSRSGCRSRSSPPPATPAGGAAITIQGTDFAAGATVTIGGQPASNVNVVGPTQITATTPALAAGTVSDLTVTNPIRRRHASESLGGGLPRRAELPHLQLLRRRARAQRDHRGDRERAVWRRPADPAPADGGVHPQGQVRRLLRAAAVHGHLRRRAVPVDLRGLDRGPRGSGHHRRLRDRRLLPAEPRAARPDGRLPAQSQVRLRPRSAAVRRATSRTSRAPGPSPSTGSSSSRTNRSPAAATRIRRATAP